MFKSSLLILLFFILGFLGFGQKYSEPTIGIFAMRDAKKLKQIKAKSVRFFVRDQDIAQLYKAIDRGVKPLNIMHVRKIHEIYKANIEMVVTLRWPDYSSHNPRLYDRVPIGKDREKVLQELRRFLNDFGKYFRIISLQNEVAGLGPGTYSQEDMTPNAQGKTPAIEWWKDVATTVREEIHQNSSLKHLEISSPTPILIHAILYGSHIPIPQINKDFHEKVFIFANQYCDYLDIHLNKNTIKQIEEVILYAKKRTNLPIITTEWSEHYSVRKWLPQTVNVEFRSWMQKQGSYIDKNTTNEEFIKMCYKNPVSKETWKRFVDTSGYLPNYMANSVELFKRYNVQYAFWNSGQQYYDSIGDPRAIFAQQTVQGNIVVDLFLQEFLSLQR